MAFFGIGAYTTAVLVKDFAVAFPMAMVAAGLLAVVFATVIGVVVLRLRGHYFAIATLGVLLAAQQVSRNLDITGGASGKILLDVPEARCSTTCSSAYSSPRWRSSTTSRTRGSASS